jgi:transcription antitermination protein NusB
VTTKPPRPAAKRAADARSGEGKPASAGRDASKAGSATAAEGYRARSLARRLAVQALYQIQINPRPWADIQSEFAADPEAERVDLNYFKALFGAIAPNCEALDSRLARLGEIPPHDLDPIEHAVLWLGLHELESSLELPYRVALAEAVQLAKQFGATDGYKFVNAVLDRAARELRPHEYGRPAE